MDDRTTQKITSQDLSLGTLIFGFLAVLITIPLILIYRSELFLSSKFPFLLASAIFWGIVSVIFIRGYWNLYYRHFYPSWVRAFAPLNFILYGFIGLGLWWLASRQKELLIFIFIVLGGVQGALEHALAIFGFRILEKVPILRDLTTLPVLIFSFFEYGFYWALVGWLALGITKLI
jgi:hypothetical protein